ncbi:G patch domain and ankyrin repeat-containing protein 1 isoform 1-T1 [Discoglossus pictus]
MEKPVVTPKKRKIDSECRVFKSSWTNDYFVIKNDGVALCLICQATIAVFKEYNIKRHYFTKHSFTFDSLTGQLRIDRVNDLIQNLIQEQTLIKTEKEAHVAPSKISFLIAEAIAKSGKPLSEGEFIKDCLGIFTSVACPEKSPLLDKISLSRQAMTRRIDDLSSNIQMSLINRLSTCLFYSLGVLENTGFNDKSQLVIFVRGVTRTFNVVEELLDLYPIKRATTGKDILNKVNQTLTKFDLPVEKLSGITTDGSPVMTDNFNGFVSLMLQSVPQKVFVHHCIINQEQLCAQTLQMKHVMDSVNSIVSFVRSNRPNPKPIQNFFKELGPDADNVPLFSRATAPTKFWLLLPEIKTFLINKGTDVSFMDDDEWLNDLAFLADMTVYLSDLNEKIQAKDQLVNKLYEHVQTFIQKLELIQKQLSAKKVVHCPTLSTRFPEIVNHEKYSVLIGNLGDEFIHRYMDFMKHSEDLELFSDPFGISAFDANDKFQLELIGIQNGSDLKRAFLEHDLLTFYTKYIPSETYPNLSLHALRYISMFGSTYCCEQLFSKMKNFKIKSKLTDGHLSGILRVATSSVPADIDYLCEQHQ